MQTRPIVFVVLAALAAATVATAAPGPARVGVEAGFAWAGVSHSLFGALFDEDPAFQPAWSAGVTVDVPLAERLTLVTGLRYLEFGEAVEVTLVSALPSDPPTYLNGTFTFHHTWRYLELPVRLTWAPWAGRGLHVSCGPEAGYLLDVASEVTTGAQRVTYAPGLAAAPTGQIFEQLGTFDDVTDFYNRWNVTLAGGLGWTIPLAGHEGAIEVRYAEGLLDMAKSTSVTQRSRGVEATLGLRW